MWLAMVTVETDPEKIKVVAEWPNSQRILKPMQNFLGVCNYYKNFIKKFSKKKKKKKRLFKMTSKKKKEKFE